MKKIEIKLPSKALYIVLAIVGITVIFDQATKLIIVRNFEEFESVKVIGDFFRLTYLQNDGAAFSILKGNFIFFYIISVVGLGFFSYALSQLEYPKNRLEVFSLALMIGGLIGNFIDRLRLRYVIDMLDFKIFGYDFPVFNFADVFLVVGSALYILTLFIGEKNAKNSSIS